MTTTTATIRTGDTVQNIKTGKAYTALSDVTAADGTTRTRFKVRPAKGAVFYADPAAYRIVTDAGTCQHDTATTARHLMAARVDASVSCPSCHVWGTCHHHA